MDFCGHLKEFPTSSFEALSVKLSEMLGKLSVKIAVWRNEDLFVDLQLTTGKNANVA